MHARHPAAGRVAAATLVLAALVAGTAFLTSGLATAADAARRAPRRTHIGIPTDDIVMLDLVDKKTSSPKFVRIHPDGTEDTNEFLVPDGRQLIVTGYDANGAWADGIFIRFWLRNRDSGERFVVFGGSVATYATRGSFTEGIVCSAGTAIDIDEVSVGNLHSRTTLQPWDTTGKAQVNLRGYLVDAD